jgi:amino acid adenylation domain-containing protein
MLDDKSHASDRVGPASGNGQAASPGSRLDSGLEPTHTVFAEEIGQSVPDRFEKIVRTYPDRLAVKMGDRALTYDELNRTANRIARAILEKRGPGSEPIALLFEHGIDVIAAIFGVLKAGKFYVAIDPSFPLERIAYIMSDSQAGLIVTNKRNVELAQKQTNDDRVSLTIEEISESLSAGNLGLSMSPDELAAITYTSGSTGDLKGLVHTHETYRHSITDYANEIHLSVDDKLSLLHSVSFGTGRVHLLLSLLNGASLFPFDVKSEGTHRLVSWLNEEQITIYHSAPALFRRLADVLPGVEKLPSLRLIRLTGAPITQLDFDLYKKNFPSRTLLQIVMGSTEAGEISSAIVDQSFAFPKAGAPVGYPRLDKKVLLLDENGHEIGPGDVGEIAVKSRYLRRGYWRRRDLTDTKFFDISDGNNRIYLTGDLGRMLPDGFLIHLGRKDFQVKIRGYRVEVAEIEKALLAHTQVTDAAVVARNRESHEDYLVAYVVPRQDPAPRINELYEFLKEKLPDYMIPSAFVFMDSLPLTNGKLDRKALPLPDHKRPNFDHPYVPAQDEVEQKVAEIWEEVLDVRPIGIRDDFFELGGYSLLGASIIAQIQKNFRVDLPVRFLAEHPTIAQLAARIKSLDENSLVLRREKQSYTYLVKLRSDQDQTLVFCFSHAGNFRGDLLRFAQLNRFIGSEYSFYGIQARGSDGKSRPHGSVEEMAAAYIEEIQTIQPHGPYFLIGECGASPIAYETAQQLRARGEEVALLAFLDSRASQPSARRYFWRRYFWYRYFPYFSWICYQIYRISESGAWNYFKARAAYHLSEIRALKGSQRLHYVFAMTGKVMGFISPASRRGISLPSEQTRVSGRGAQPNAGKLEDRIAAAYPLYPLYRLHRLRYRHRPYARKITILTNEEWYDADPTLGWTELAIGGLEVHKIPGNHDTYITKNINLVTEQLRECLDRAKLGN